jgi:hypothetical protein
MGPHKLKVIILSINKTLYYYYNKNNSYWRVQSKVEIDPAMQRDAGYYECQAHNKHAVDVKVTQLL